MPRKAEGSRPLTNAERAARKRIRKASKEQRLVDALEDLSQMATETTNPDPDPAYCRAYADIASYVRAKARDALGR
jgi:hypothetical protein